MAHHKFLSVRSKIFFSQVLVSLTVLFLAFTILNLSLKKSDQSDLVLNSQELLYHSQKLLSNSQRLTVDANNYLSSKDRQYLDQFSLGEQKLIKDLKRLKELTKQDHSRKVKVKFLEYLLNQHHSLYRDVLTQPENKVAPDKMMFIFTTGNDLLSQISKVIEEFQNHEDKLLFERNADLRNSTRLFSIAVYSLLFMLLVFIILISIRYRYSLIRRHRVQKEIRHNEEKFKTFYLHSLNGILLGSVDGEILNANPAACLLFGMSEQELIEKGRPGVVFKDKNFERFFKSRNEFGQAKGELTLIRKNGEHFPAEVTSNIFNDGSGYGRTIIIINDISERKKAEDLIRTINNDLERKVEEKTREALEQQIRLTNTLENLLEGVQIISPEWRYVYVNKSFEKHGGYPKEFFTGKTVFDLFPQFEQSELHKVASECLSDHVPRHFETKVQLPDGSKKWLEFSIQPVPEGLFILSVDITERKKAERQFEEQKRFTETVLNQLPADVAVFDPYHNYIFLNYKAIANKEVREWLIGKNDFQYYEHKGLDPAMAIKRRKLFESAVHGKQDVTWVDQHLTKDGNTQFIMRKFSPLYEHDKLKYVIGYGIDITELKRAELLLDQSGQKYRQVVENLNDGLLVQDLTGKIEFVNNRFLEMMQIDERSTHDLDIMAIFKTSDSSAAIEKEYMTWIQSSNPNFFFVIDVKVKEELRWFEIRSTKVFEGGIHKGFLAAVKDVTNERTEAAKSKNLAELNRKIISASDELFYVIKINDVHSYDNPIIYISDTVQDFYGITAEQIIKKPEIWLSYVHPDDRNVLIETTDQLYNSKKPVSRIYRSKNKKTGDYGWFYDFVSPVLDEQGNVTEIYGSLKDITELKEKEIQLDQLITELSVKYNNQMQFNYIVSHNLRSPIANILGLVHVLNKTPQMEENAKEKILSHLSTATKKMDQLLMDLNEILSSTAPLNLKKEPIYLPTLIESISDTLEKQIREANVQINFKFSHSSKSAYSFKSYFESVFYNLISNAIKYRSSERQPVIEIKSFEENDRLIFTIEDNGIGIDLEMHGKSIFGLYKRFNLDVEGKGLGLHMTKIQVEALGGNISVESSPGLGTTFSLTFPKNISHVPEKKYDLEPVLSAVS